MTLRPRYGLRLYASRPITRDELTAALARDGFRAAWLRVESHSETWLDTPGRDLAASGATLAVHDGRRGRHLVARGPVALTGRVGESFAGKARLGRRPPPRSARSLPGALRDIVTPFALDARLEPSATILVRRDRLRLRCGARILQASLEAHGPAQRFTAEVALESIPAAERLAACLAERLDFSTVGPNRVATAGATRTAGESGFGDFLRESFEDARKTLAYGELWQRAARSHESWHALRYGSMSHWVAHGAREIQVLVVLAGRRLDATLACRARRHLSELTEHCRANEILVGALAEAGSLAGYLAEHCDSRMARALGALREQLAGPFSPFDAEIHACLDDPKRMAVLRALGRAFHSLTEGRDAGPMLVDHLRLEDGRLRAELAELSTFLSFGQLLRLHERLAVLDAAAHLSVETLGKQRVSRLTPTRAIVGTVRECSYRSLLVRLLSSTPYSDREIAEAFAAMLPYAEGRLAASLGALRSAIASVTGRTRRPQS